MASQTVDLKDLVFHTLLSSSVSILRSSSGARLDGAIYDGPVAMDDKPNYIARLNAVENDIVNNENSAHHFVTFSIQELKLEDRNGQIRISTPKDPSFENVEFYIFGYGLASRPGNKPILRDYPFNADQTHVAVVPRGVARHFQTYEEELVNPHALHASRFPMSLHPFMLSLDVLSEGLSRLLRTAKVGGAVYTSPQTGVRFSGWKAHFTNDMGGLQANEGTLAVTQRNAGTGGEHYFRYE